MIDGFRGKEGRQLQISILVAILDRGVNDRSHRQTQCGVPVGAGEDEAARHVVVVTIVKTQNRLW